jgi:hypothetical protein
MTMKNYSGYGLPDPMLEQRIRLRAYDLYIQGGRKLGHALADWLRAEAEIVRELQADRFTPPSFPSARR